MDAAQEGISLPLTLQCNGHAANLSISKEQKRTRRTTRKLKRFPLAHVEQDPEEKKEKKKEDDVTLSVGSTSISISLPVKA